MTLNKASNGQLSELMKFKQQWGHCDVTKKYSRKPNIGGWERHHRSQYRLLKRGKKYSISDEKIAQVETLGFKWNFQAVDVLQVLE